MRSQNDIENSKSPQIASAEAYSPWLRRKRLVKPCTIPILMYHKVGSPIHCKADRYLNVMPSEFAQHVRFLKRLGYQAITFKQAVQGMTRGAQLPPHPVCFTFDDAYQSIADCAAPILAAEGWPATVFVATAHVGDVNVWDKKTGKAFAPIMDWDSVRHLEAQGWEVGAHTRTHPRLEQLDDVTALQEIAGSKSDLEQQLGKPIESFCYPFGRYKQATLHLVRAAGFAGACTTHKRWAEATDQALRMPRIGISRGEMAGFVYRLFVQTHFVRKKPRVPEP